MEEQKFNMEDGIMYICVYKGTNLGIFSENSIDYNISDATSFNDFIERYTKTGTPELFLKQVEELEDRVRKSNKDARCLSNTERQMACLNIISLVKKGRLENNENFGYIKMICKDKNVVIHMDE
tara:strand:- start:156 stop:527 length:372 start_codon:yes stop_codon:yes gene_type:complete